MTDKSKLYIGIILGSLLVMAGVTATRFIKSAGSPKNAALQETQEEFQFNQEAAEAPKAHDDAAFPSDYYSTNAKTDASQMVRPVYGNSAQGSAFEEKLMRYYEDPAMQAFNHDIRQAAGDISFENFLDSDFQDKYLKNPQIQKILLEYSKDPAFMTLMQDMVTDKEFMSEAMRHMDSSVNNINKK